MLRFLVGMDQYPLRGYAGHQWRGDQIMKHPLLIRALGGLAGGIGMYALFEQRYLTAVLAALALAGLSCVAWLSQKNNEAR
jgi:hypothetical protein